MEKCFNAWGIQKVLFAEKKMYLQDSDQIKLVIHFIYVTDLFTVEVMFIITIITLLAYYAKAAAY